MKGQQTLTKRMRERVETCTAIAERLLDESQGLSSDELDPRLAALRSKKRLALDRLRQLEVSPAGELARSLENTERAVADLKVAAGAAGVAIAKAKK
jgi:hypothetical protein